MNIRKAILEESDHIRRIHIAAFPAEENTAVAKLATDLLKEEAVPPVLSLVAEADDTLVGHIAFSPVYSNNPSWQGYILAPLGVLPEYQNRLVGSALINDGMQRLMAMGVNVLFVYGDPKYYGRFGFSTEVAASYSPPYALQYPFGWQALILKGDNQIEPPAQLTCVQALSDPSLW